MNVKKCPRCGSDGRVYDSRVDSKDRVFRLRKCVKCGHKWKTYEIMSYIYDRVTDGYGSVTDHP